MGIFDFNEDINIVVELEGMPELKKLLSLASEQIEQLEKTLVQLNDINLRIVPSDIQKRRRKTLSSKK